MSFLNHVLAGFLRPAQFVIAARIIPHIEPIDAIYIMVGCMAVLFVFALIAKILRPEG